MTYRIQRYASGIWQECLTSAHEIQQTLFTVFSTRGALLIGSLNHPDAYEKLTKAVISDLEFLQLIPAINGIFTKCMATLNGLKDLYYTTLSVTACASFVKTDEKGNPISLQMPRYSASKGGGIDWTTFFWCLSAYFDTAQFLRKHSVYEFAAYTKYIGPLGFYGIYYKLNEIPVIQTLFDGRPREFFIVAASLAELVTGLKEGWRLFHLPEDQRSKVWALEKWGVYLKIAGSTGRIIGMACYRDFMGAPWLVVVGLIGNNANLFKIILESYRRRSERFG